MQQHKIQRETQESNSTKHEVKHKNAAAQTTKGNTRIQQHKIKRETQESSSKNTK